MDSNCGSTSFLGIKTQIPREVVFCQNGVVSLCIKLSPPNYKYMAIISINNINII